ncbi:MAG: rhomboid family intramembrane serine protease [Chloroflexota bacterium]
MTATNARLTWAILAVNVLFFLFLELRGGSQNAAVLVQYGAKFGPLIAEGEWWRLIAPVFMHIGAFHLLANSIGLIIFGSIVEGAFGRPAFIATYMVAGIAGNVASYAAGPTVGAGASGAIFGLLGAFGVYLYLNKSALGQAASSSLGGLGFILAINVIFGLITPGIDNMAHLGGLVAGAAMAGALSPRVRMEPIFWFGERPLYVRPRQEKPSPMLISLSVILALAALSLTTVLVNTTYPDDPTGRFGSTLAPHERLYT